MDKKWVTIAAIVGIVAVVAIALVFFLGGGNNPGTSPGQTTPTPSGIQTQVSATGTTSPTIRQPTPVIIPATGLFVKVSYLGSFNGTYGINSVIQKVRNSGDRLYTIDSATGNVTATFSKEDRSSHTLTVEVWKDGKLLTSAVNSTAFGTASITYHV
jgi:hypothetical protein